MLVTGLFWLVTSAGYPGLLALKCGCTVSPFVSSLTSSLRYETLIIHPGQGFLILISLLPPTIPADLRKPLIRCYRYSVLLLIVGIGKYLSRLRTLDHVIAPSEGFAA